VKRAFAVEDIAKRADGYGIPGVHIDGRDVRAVLAAAGEAVARARAGKGPTFIVADSYRHEGHYYGDPRKYQSKDEIDGWRKLFDPIADARAWIVADGLASAADLDAADREIAAEIDRAVAWAEQGPLASPIRLPGDVYASD
jgi:TPP-dependent pyruvate/acetoin dehydrogenase alpha subunit